ncbi:type VI secretion system baseplate subunit TssG [Duganella levis]|uniref:Type VI secretion system baseplate subunit TssG n=1 Tax=Duganella levis TaxID=2692169 RepID=A0ABW9W5Q2_9BURK|nr:type VI secretion system baseplate subunit TssG [Duganella levis]MYN29381.1 type VI secretion system baseplate subunit TssG [Duganella levis]
MPTTKRRRASGVIQQLLDDPYRFEFFQAVQLLERWMAAPGMAPGTVLTELMHFKNSRNAGFPASQIESLTLDESGVSITPAFFGFLGNHGVMPDHYGERIAACRDMAASEATYAYFDIFSNRFGALFYEAWRKHRLELRTSHGKRDGFMPLLLALSGGTVQTVPDQVAACYAAQFGHRPQSAVLMQQVLSDYFQICVKVISHVGRWHRLEDCHQAELGGENVRLGDNTVLGARIWRRDLTAVIQLGPLGKTQYENFFESRPGALELKQVLSMFETSGLHYEVQLILACAEVQGVTLSNTSSARLGIDSFLLSRPETRDRSDMRYRI